jgi:hypothetical protein
MPEGARVAARETVGTIEKTPTDHRTPKAYPLPRTLQAQLLHWQRTVGNQAVQRLIRSGLPQPTVKTKPLTQREMAQAEEGPQQPDRNEAAAEPTSCPPAGPATRISPLIRQTVNAPHIQTAWYNFHIPFTDYEFDPSLEGLKTAGNLAAEKAKEGATWVKDKVVAAAEWVFEKIKGLINGGIDWLTDKFNEIQKFAVSSFADIKGALSGALGAITSPLGAITNAIGAMDSGILAAAWRALSAGANAAWQTAKGVINGVLKVGGGIWETVSGYVDSLFSAVDNLLDSTAFGLLPGFIQDGARSLYKTVHNLWTSIRHFWTDFWKRLTSFVKDLLGSIEAFVHKVVSYAIDKVVETVKKLKEVYDFVKRLVTDPESVIRPIIANIAGKIQAEAPGKAREVAQQKMTEALASSQSSQSSATVVHVHRSPDGASAKRSTATRAEVNEGVNRALADQWAALDIPKMLWDTVVNMFWPPATIRAIGHEFYELWNTDWKNAADSLFTPRNIFDDFGGFWHDVWSNFLILLDFPLALWRRLNSILMLLMGYVSIILILVGLVGGFIVGNVPGALAAAAAGAQLAWALGEALFLSFVLAESLSALKAFLDLYTARQTEQEKARDYLQIAASTIGIGVAIVIAILFSLLGALVRDVVGRIKAGGGAKTAVKPGDVEPPDVKSPDTKPPETKPPENVNVIKLDSPARIDATKPVQMGDVLNWKLFDSVSQAQFSDVDVDITDPANPGAPDQYLTPKDATLPSGDKVKLEADFSFTDESLKKNQSVWEEHFKKPLTDYSGSLADENLGNFQAEYAKIRVKNPGLSPQEIGDLAIREVSFGKGRIRVFFGKLSVMMEGFQDVDIKMGPNRGQHVENVPTVVKVSAKKTVP